MATFDDFLDALRQGVKDLVQSIVPEAAEKALEVSEKFVDDSKEDLEKWFRQLAQGELSEDQFKFFVEGKKDLLEVHLLTQAGVALVAAEKFRRGLIDLVINTALSFL